MKLGFDNEKYLQIQSQHIKERIARFGDKLYLEFGGKLFDDHHAARVLPGFQPDSKLRMLMQLKDEAEVVFVISAADIEKNKVRADLGITYDKDVLRLRDEFTHRGLYVSSVVITHYNGQSSAAAFRKRLERLGVKVYYHYLIEGYPTNVELIASDEGFGKNEFVETTRPLVVITAPGPGSGKMAVCLSQLYNEQKRGVKAGYAKFETFPIWNLPLDHAVNYAYEAATADLNDENRIDPYHLKAYGKEVVSYNRDIEVFPVLRATFELIWGKCPYNSPTDMGVNMVGFCLTDNDVCSEASRREILRRWFVARTEYKKGNIEKSVIEKAEAVMEKAGVSIADNPAIAAARIKENNTGAPAAAMELPDGRVISGKTSALMGSAAALILNALKVIGGIPKDVKLISPEVLEPITNLKTQALGHHNPRLHTDEVLIALCMSAVTNPDAKLALDQLTKLRRCGAFFTVIPSQVDEKTYKQLGITTSCEPVYEVSKLYHK